MAVDQVKQINDIYQRQIKKKTAKSFMPSLMQYLCNLNMLDLTQRTFTLFKINNGNSTTIYYICSKLATKTPKPRD